MIIPVKCFTCGMVLADKYRYYQNEVRRIKLLQGKSTENVIYLTKGNTEKTIEGTILDDLGLTKVCCRRHMLTHVDIERRVVNVKLLFFLQEVLHLIYHIL